VTSTDEAAQFPKWPERTERPNEVAISWRYTVFWRGKLWSHCAL